MKAITPVLGEVSIYTEESLPKRRTPTRSFIEGDDTFVFCNVNICSIKFKFPNVTECLVPPTVLE